MSTVKDLITQLERAVGDEVDPNVALDWFNEANDVLSGVARVRTTEQDTDFAGGETYTLPTDLLEVVEVRYGEDTDSLEQLYDLHLYRHRSSGYRLWGSTLQFSEELDEGVIEVDYFKHLDELQLDLSADPIVNSTPELPPQFHYLYVAYAASRYWSNWNDEEEPEQLRRLDFERGKQELDLYTMAQGKYGPFHTRDVLPRRSREAVDTDDDSWDDYIGG